MNGASLARFLLLGSIWGSSYTFIKVGVEELTPSQLVLGRLMLGAVVLLSFVYLRGIRLPKFDSTWAHLCVTAVLGMVAPFLLLAWGEQYTSAAMAGVLISTLPLCTLGVAAALLRTDQITGRKVLGLFIGFAGVIFVLSPWQENPGSLGGNLAVLGAALCYALQTVYIRRILSTRGFPPLALAAAQLLMATVMQMIITPVSGWETPSLTWQVVVSVAILGVFATAAAYALYFRLIADLGATTASSVNYLVPVVALVTSVALLSDTVTWSMLLGVVAVLIGLAVAENRLRVPQSWRGRRQVVDPETPEPEQPEQAADQASR